jgi:hypothetical protein
MSAPTPTVQSRAHGAPACYLAQPATWSLTTYYSRPGQHHTRHAAAGPAGTAPAGPGAG